MQIYDNIIIDVNMWVSLYGIPNITLTVLHVLSLHLYFPFIEMISSNIQSTFQINILNYLVSVTAGGPKSPRGHM